MQRKIKIDLSNSTIRIPSEFLKKFRRNKQHRKINATMIYDEPDICTEDTFIILIDEAKQ